MGNTLLVCGLLCACLSWFSIAHSYEIIGSLNNLSRSLEMLSDKLSGAKKGYKKELQKMPSSSIIEELSQGKVLSAHEKTNLFKQDCRAYKAQNSLIPAKKENILRIMTYNVHKWLTPNMYENTSAVMDIIDQLNPDICILQESSVTSDPKMLLNIEKTLQDKGYKYVFCHARNFGKYIKFGNIIAYKNHMIVTTVSKSYQAPEVGEGRCYVAITFKLPSGEKISVYGTHLDAYGLDGATREQQLKELMHDISTFDDHNIIVAGDFNAVRKQDYDYIINNKNVWNLVSQEYEKIFKVPLPTRELAVLEKYGFKNCFSFANIVGPRFTVWAGVVVDFIFLNAAWNLPVVGCYVYYDTASDHLPVIMDIALRLTKIQ